MSTDLDTTPQPQWYYARDGQRAGPIGQGVLCQWLASGQIPAATLVWHEAGQAWVEARALPVFVAAIEQRTAAAVPPPPPPAPPTPQPATTITSEPTRVEDAAAKPGGRKLLRWAVPAAACAAVAAILAFKSTSAPQAATAQPVPVVAAAPVAPQPAAKKPAEPPTLRIKISAVPTQPPAAAKPATPSPATRPAVAAKPLVTPPSMDDLAQRRAAIGRWVLIGKPSGADQRRPRTTLTLAGDGRFEQAVDFCDADGNTLAGGAWTCRGTWSVRNGQLVQDVAQTTNANYPAGRWAFAVQAAPAALRLDRVAAPAAYAYAGRKASYAFARAAVAVTPTAR